jgi:hypothetical protein
VGLGLFSVPTGPWEELITSRDSSVEGVEWVPCLLSELGGMSRIYSPHCLVQPGTLSSHVCACWKWQEEIPTIPSVRIPTTCQSVLVPKKCGAESAQGPPLMLYGKAITIAALFIETL